MKLKIKVGLTALGAVLLGLSAQAQNPASTAEHSGNGSSQTYPQGPPALRPDSLNDPTSTTILGSKPNMTRRERRQLRRRRMQDKMVQGMDQNAHINRNGENTTAYPTQDNTGSSQNGNTGMYNTPSAAAVYTDTTRTTSPDRPMSTMSGTGMSNVGTDAGNQNGNTGINPQGTSTSGYTGSTGNTGTMNPAGTSTGMSSESSTIRMNAGNATGVARNIPNVRTLSITDYTSAAPEYTMLVNALQVTDMTNMLEGNGQYTVFAPSNNAFNKLPATTRNNLLKGQNQDRLKNLLSYHIVQGAVDAKEIARRMNEGNGKARLQTLAGGTLTVEMGTNGRLKITDDQGGIAYVESPDHFQSNGIVHGVDKVLLPKGITVRFR
ncbi:hypothetical protein GCM10023187_01950 [Nibrella viscosa]|uniref:FAS1 domain-containing protein n=1 Tax=Nibrella viscosa TaxID=1084524 RepID=A0ABP8JSA3_9BACT